MRNPKQSESVTAVIVDHLYSPQGCIIIGQKQRLVNDEHVFIVLL